MKKIILLTIVAIIANTVSAQWQPTSLNSGGVLSLATDNTNIFAGILGEGMFLSINNGNSWDTINNGLPQNSNVISLAINDTNIFAGTSGEGMFLSTNNGSNWVAVNNGLPANSSVISLAINDTNIFAGISGHKVFLSTDNGNNWTSINNGITFLNVYALAISGTNIFAGTDVGVVYLSSNNGNSWTEVNHGIPLAPSYPFIRALVISGSNIIAGSDAGIFLSIDNGNSWITTGYLVSEVYTLIKNGTNVFAGTSGGIFLSTDNGNSWNDVSDGLTNKNILSIAICDTSIYAGTNGSGVWKRSLSEMGIEENPFNNPEITVYPNPTNNNELLNIKFSSEKISTAQVNIYNSLGALEFQTTEKIIPFENMFSIDVSTLTQGMYLLQVVLDRKVYSNKFIIK